MTRVERLSGEHNSDSRQAFIFECLDQADNPPSGDPVIGAWNAAVVDGYRSIPAYRELIDTYVAKETVENVSYQVNKNVKCLQALVIPDTVRHCIGYPEKFADKNISLDFIKANLSDRTNPNYLKLQRLLLEMPLQTNRSSRAKTIAFAATSQFLKHPIDYAPVVYDFGSSNNLILKALAIHMIDKTIVHDRDGEPDNRLSMLFDMYTSLAPFKEGVGIEANPPRTSEELEFHKSCTLDPSQLDREQTGTYEDVYDVLTDIQPPKAISTVETYFPDIDKRDHRKLKNKKADIAFFSHSLCQNNNAELILKKMMEYMNPRGLIIVQDYLEVNPDRPSDIRFLDHWYDKKWLCKTVVLDMKDPSEGFTPVFEWETAHCKTVRLLPGISKLTSQFG
jgi:hypothetical protein